jgi:hypothetical protein
MGGKSTDLLIQRQYVNCQCEEWNDEAIPYLLREIATLPSVARNDTVKGFNAFVSVNTDNEV